MKSYFKFRYILLCVIFVSALNAGINIRCNQLGFNKNDIKSAIIISTELLDGKEYSILEIKTKKNVFSGKIGRSKGKYGNFKYSYEVFFTELQKEGTFQVAIGNNKSYPFEIGLPDYKNLVQDLLYFFKIQRCGYTNPELHKVCHIADATSLIENNKAIKKTIDVTGGWHDAGDYVKFLNTTAFATYMLLFSYEFDPVTFGFDNNKNNVPDILEEAKIGLDWMHRAYFEKNKFIVQVQDLRDHNYGFRMPETDTLRFDRPGFVGFGKNLIGIFSATMALGAKIWDNTLHFKEYSDKCLNAARMAYSQYPTAPDISKEGSGMYIDGAYKGKLALGAVELYNITKEGKYLSEAKKFATEAGADHWWSYGNINTLAHFRIAQYDKKFADFIEKNLIEFNKFKKTKIFNEATPYSWGTNNALLGVSLQAIMWKKIKKLNTYDSLAILQRDYTLGRNPWGVSFFFGQGINYARNFHSQVAYLTGGKLKGGFAAGPIAAKTLESYNIKFENRDNYREFQTDEAVYRDDCMDYVTNEPTITANATAIFVMGYYASQK